MSDTEPQRILVTSALPYVNGPPHLGHLAGAYLPADIYCRYQRLMGRDVVYICGSDEHGVPIMLRARREGVSPQDIVDRFHAIYQKAFDGIGMSFDYYGRTSSETHRETSQAFFRAMAEKGAFVQRTESQLFDPEANIFLADRFVRGTCPDCGYDDAYGDQCERCGRALSPNELIKPRSAITDASPVLKETTHWYLPLDKAQEWIESWIEGKSHWKQNVLGQIRSWLQDGLAERAMTRDLPWGVPVPADIAEKAGVDASGKVLYVWFDAPIGYISASREWAAAKGEPDAWERYWKQDDTKLVHFIGKDNIVFHCIIFPTMLRERGGYVLPDNVPANEFLNLRGLKFSTSRGVAVWLHEFLEKYPADYLRYATAKIIPESKDTDFSWEGLQAAVNNELADTLGNFVNRSLTFAHKYFEGKVPPLEQPNDRDQAMLASLADYPRRVGESIDAYRFREAVNEAMGLAREGNKYFNDSEPWRTRKDDMRQCGNTIHVSLQLCASLSILLEPVIPFSCAKIREVIGYGDVRSSAPGGAEDAVGWMDASGALLAAGHALGKPQILFRKLTDEEVQGEVEELKRRAESPAEATEAPYAELNDTIVYDDFAKLDLRVGLVTVAERLPKSKKLIRTEVDLGFESRQILAGVAQHMAPEDLLGKKVIVVANLAPRKLFGLESQGMLLMAEDREGNLVPVTTESEPGSVVN